MKTKFFFLPLMLIFLSCTDSMQETLEQDTLKQSFQVIQGDHLITYDNIVAISKSCTEEDKASVNDEPVINCILGENKDTLLYVRDKKDGGWVIYSSDTRVPPIVAESDQGSYAELMENKHAMIWIQTMAEDMQVIRTLDDDALNFSAEEIEANKTYWKSITDPDGFVKELLAKNGTKDGLPHGPTLPTGHYEYIFSEYYYEVYDSISRLTAAYWNQWYPYNLYCPYISTTINYNIYDHVPAGCVAIAGAEMLHFLHFKFGVPATAPSEAYCNSLVTERPYDWAQYNPSATIWNLMDTMIVNNVIPNGYSAPLIADVGRRLDINYGDTASGAYPERLVDSVFIHYGISCSLSSYNNTNTNNLTSNLLNGIPSILSAFDSTETVGHAFIADRYKRTRQVEKRYYQWVWDSNPNNVLLPFVERKIEYTYQSPAVSYIGMNWGWGKDYYSENEWFSITGDWILASTAYNTSRKIIYNFHVLSNN